MSKVNYNVLIIEDHPLIAEGYVSAFDKVCHEVANLNFEINITRNCDQALEVLKDFKQSKKVLNIVFLDIRLPIATSNKNVLSGEDIGIRIRQSFPEAKILISTSLNDNYRFHSILKSINPDAFLVKTDINSTELVNAIKKIINTPPYYSNTVLQLLRKTVSNDFLLDDKDRRILYELSIGTKMKELPNLIPLSIASIEKRKRHLKQIFNIKSFDDRELILIAKEKGFI